MRKLFERIVDFMEENGSIQSEYRDIYLFALQTVAVYAFNIGTGVVIGAAFGELLYCMIFLIAFMLLRQEAGGYHAPGWMSCYFLSCGILVLTLLWIKAEFAYQTCLSEYNQYISQELDKISRLAKENNWGKRKIQKEIRMLQSEVKKNLKKGVIKCH